MKAETRTEHRPQRIRLRRTWDPVGGEQEVPGRGAQPHTASPDGVQRPAQVDAAEWNFDEPTVTQLACDSELADHRRIATRTDQDFDCRVPLPTRGRPDQSSHCTCAVWNSIS
jgi:hypothetical protein